MSNAEFLFYTSILLVILYGFSAWFFGKLFLQTKFGLLFFILTNLAIELISRFGTLWLAITLLKTGTEIPLNPTIEWTTMARIISLSWALWFFTRNRINKTF